MTIAIRLPALRHLHPRILRQSHKVGSAFIGFRWLILAQTLRAEEKVEMKWKLRKTALVFAS